MRPEQGLVHLYYGDGKGKTTAAFGLALRCAGRGKNVVVAQFLKGGASGELDAVRRFPEITVFRGKPTGKFTFQMNDEEKAATARQCAAIFRDAADAAENARLLVLDEAVDACVKGFLSMEDMVEFLRKKPERLEVVLTGHSLPAELAGCADYISHMVKEKHPFDLGVKARADIEF
ncbi:MAG: cob(I)yrinic acid a,c-diamide adenosyltransferase [Clostridia bacterium]|nr:cob(I)yrinic acid a,c-diamide adenosyltransferase [Clostridia bacterium]